MSSSQQPWALRPHVQTRRGGGIRHCPCVVVEAASTPPAHLNSHRPQHGLVPNRIRQQQAGHEPGSHRAARRRRPGSGAGPISRSLESVRLRCTCGPFKATSTPPAPQRPPTTAIPPPSSPIEAADRPPTHATSGHAPPTAGRRSWRQPALQRARGAACDAPADQSKQRARPRHVNGHRCHSTTAARPNGRATSHVGTRTAGDPTAALGAACTAACEQRGVPRPQRPPAAASSPWDLTRPTSPLSTSERG